MSRILSAGLLLTSFGFFVLAVVTFLAARDAPGVTVEEPERELADVNVGQVITVTFHIRNPTGHGARVVGLSKC
jgi:uncharacterized protein (DUF58 family)